MLQLAKSLIGAQVLIAETSVGTIRDIIFDANEWQIRYILVRTGGWLNRKSVFIFPSQIIKIDWPQQAIQLSITQHQFNNNPTLNSHFFDYYHWPYFWTGAGIWGVAATSDIFKEGTPPEDPSEFKSDNKLELKKAPPLLKSIIGTLDYHTQASDSDLGYIEDFSFDDQIWAIRYVVVDARTLWPNRSLIFSPEWIESIDWDQLNIRFRFASELIRGSPSFNFRTVITPEYEKSLSSYYQRAGQRRSDLIYKKVI